MPKRIIIATIILLSAIALGAGLLTAMSERAKVMQAIEARNAENREVTMLVCKAAIPHVHGKPVEAGKVITFSFVSSKDGDSKILLCVS